MEVLEAGGGRKFWLFGPKKWNFKKIPKGKGEFRESLRKEEPRAGLQGHQALRFGSKSHREFPLDAVGVWGLVWFLSFLFCPLFPVFPVGSVWKTAGIQG